MGHVSQDRPLLHCLQRGLGTMRSCTENTGLAWVKGPGAMCRLARCCL